jgi:hypothetical protein
VIVIRRIRKLPLIIVGVAALALGGSQLASARSHHHRHHHQSTHQSVRHSQSRGTENQSEEQPGSEVPNNDGPGGHADEPANPNADHQFQGEE